MLTDEQLAYLEKKQGEYGQWHQDIGQTMKFMAENSHPYSAAFKVQRSLFDSLPYASGPGTRFYSFKDECNYSELIPPYLWVAPAEPSPDEGAMEYLAKLAKTGWSGIKTSINLGKWRIATTDIQLADALIFADAKSDHHVQNSTIYIQFDDMTQEVFDKVRDIIDRHHEGNVLIPKRMQAVMASLRMPSIHGYAISAPDAWL